MNVLICWVGRTDLLAQTKEQAVGEGPISQAVKTAGYDRVVLLHDYPVATVSEYASWLQRRHTISVTLAHEPLSGPTNFGEIYQAATSAIGRVRSEVGSDASLTYHLSPGTPAMAAVWILIAKTRFPATLIESSREHGVREAVVPFDIAVDFLPDLLREADQRLEQLSRGLPPEAPEFAAIVHQCAPMQRLIARARRVALRRVPVLIEGESGTGKELLSRAIHRASPRRDAPFIAVNCGAISPELVESELFGHEKGAFSGAVRRHVGYFEAAHRGTLMLDEIGDLPASAQVKLLRVLQEGEVVRVGGTQPVKVDVRIIAATHRTMTTEIAEGRFREDLFYRLAVAILKLPALRDRPGDLGLLIDALLEQVNVEGHAEPGFERKTLSAGARNLMLQHRWPGNVRELLNTLRRAALWSVGPVIRTEDMVDALLPARLPRGDGVLGRSLEGGVDLPGIMASVARDYLSRAMREAGGNKTRAARLLGLGSYQTLGNWLKKYGVE